MESGRYRAAGPPRVAEGWTLTRLTPPSRLFGANGVRAGPDGRLYVAQAMGSQISAIDIATGAIDTVSPIGGDIVGPDDLVFDGQGNLYATEITEGRVSMLTPSGQARVVCGDMPCANPITFHQGRLLAGECRHGGRILELDRSGGRPRVLLENVPMPNAMEVGPDGKLYFPVMEANEIWRLDLRGGQPETVATGLGVPDSVKFDAQGYIVSTQVASGQVLRIDPRTGERSVLADIGPGLDNSTFIGTRLFVSSISGRIDEILPGGQLRSLMPDGMRGPLGIAAGADGLLYVADGTHLYTLRASVGPEPAPARLRTAGMIFTPGWPGFARGVAVAGPDDLIMTTSNGAVARYRPGRREGEPLAEGLDQLYGVAMGPRGDAIVAELGGGRVLAIRSGAIDVLATGLDRPTAVAVAADGESCFVSESGAGRVVKVRAGRAQTVLDGLRMPQGIALHAGRLYVVDPADKELIEYDLASGIRKTIAHDLPIGAPAGVTPKPLRGAGGLSGPLGPFADIAVGSDGALYLSADAEGSVLALHSDPK